MGKESNRTPKISVVIPVYGVERFIERCVRSLFEQTHKEIEYIVVNDCTKDGSMNVLDSVLADYGNLDVKIINLEKNGGLPNARRIGVEHATGDYILHVDSDDYVETDMVEKLCAKAAESNADMVCFDWFDEFDDHREQISHFEANRDLYYENILALDTDAYVWSRMAKRSLYQGLEFPKCNMFEDYVITSQLVAKCESIEFIHDPFYHYIRNNADSIRSSADTRKILTQEIINIYDVYSRLKRTEPGKHPHIFGRQIFAMGYHMMRHNLYDSLPKEQRRVIHEDIKKYLPDKSIDFSVIKQHLLWFSNLFRW